MFGFKEKMGRKKVKKEKVKKEKMKKEKDKNKKMKKKELRNNDLEKEKGNKRKNNIGKILGVLMWSPLLFTACDVEYMLEENSPANTIDEANMEDANTENANTENANTENANTKNANTENDNTDKTNTDKTTIENTTIENANTEDATIENTNTEDANTKNVKTESANTENTNAENTKTKNTKTENTKTENAKTENTNTENANSENSADLDELLSSCTYLTKEMYERATAYKEGDLTRIAAAMRKASSGEKVTIGVIGGSITQGYSASQNSNCYASLLKRWWEDTFPDAEIEFINAGVGGTGSYLGVHRVYDDLLIYKPDFVVVEFSVNDGNSIFYKKSYDNLVRRILKEENDPAVVLLFMTMEDGTSAQDIDANIGFQYGLPMISYRNAVLVEVEKNNIAWKNISPDNIHPNDIGHAIVGELFSVYLTNIYHELDTISTEVTPFDLSPVTKEVYLDATILDSRKIEPIKWGSFEKKSINYTFSNGWSTESGEDSIVFIVEAANIGIMYQKFTDGTGGQYEVYVDGDYTMTLDADFSDGWGDYGACTEVFASRDKKERTIEIKKKEGVAGDAFAVLGLLIS